MQSAILEFYAKKNILLTGGTGFFGKMIVEKLLRTTEINNIYLIIRPKQGFTIEERIKIMLEDKIFDSIRMKKSTLFKNICPIRGDLSKIKLDLEENDRELIKQNVNIILHCGASLNMDSKLSDAVLTNVRGTKEIMKLVREIEHLQAFLLVSTAYSNCVESNIEESFYKPPIDPDLLIRMTEEINPDLLSTIGKGLVSKWPNSYVFTKAVAESLLLKYCPNQPIGLFRPSIVTSTAYEPVPGWTDNMYGPVGLLLSQHCGVLRILRGNSAIKADTVPGDMAINALLCFAWNVNEQWSNQKLKYEPLVINFSGKNSELYLPIRSYVDCAKRSNFIRFKKAIWYPILLFVNNAFYYSLLKFILHTIPAYVVDLMLMCIGQRPRMKKIYLKLEKFTNVLYYFLSNEWNIDNKNTIALWSKLNYHDKKLFNFDVASIVKETYLMNMMLGIKKFILKEDMTRYRAHNAKFKRLTILHNILKYILCFCLTYPMYQKLSKFVLTILFVF